MAIWEQRVETSKQVLALTRTVDRHTDELAALRAEVTDMRRDFEAVPEALHEMRFEQLHDRAAAAKDREILLLRL